MRMEKQRQREKRKSENVVSACFFFTVSRFRPYAMLYSVLVI